MRVMVRMQMVVNMHVVVDLAVMLTMVLAMVMLAASVALGLAACRRVRDRLHGRLSGRRPTDERCHGECRDGYGWKLHGLGSLWMRFSPPTHKAIIALLE